MLQKLFGSKIRLKILSLFILNPKREYYSREIEREIRANFEAIRKMLLGLEETKLLKSRISGKQRYYSVDTKHVLYPEIKSMILKTIGLGDILRDAFKDNDKIDSVFIYGSYAKNREDFESDVDIFVVGDISSKNLQTVISEIENKFQREINPTIYSALELREKYKAKNPFILSVFKQPKLFLKGDERGLRELVKYR
ncbi:nucleotidyltransferase domain-containing protein [Candidatus Omnitrophota bacterium]